MTASFVQPDATGQEPAAYKTAIDGSVQVLARHGAMFHVQQQEPASMELDVLAGRLPRLGAPPVEVAAATVGPLAAPASDPRHDIVYLDAATGAAAVATGSEAPSPDDPALPPGALALARVRLAAGATEIANADLDDLRQLALLGIKQVGADPSVAWAGQWFS